MTTDDEMWLLSKLVLSAYFKNDSSRTESAHVMCHTINKSVVLSTQIFSSYLIFNPFLCDPK